MILSGILLTPTGVPYKNSSVRITANNTSPDVLMFVQKDFKTDVDGEYEIDVPNGWYHVSVFSLEYRSYVNIGNIEVTDLTTETTINALLMIGQTAGSDPLVAQVAANAASALASKNAAAVSATNASTSATSAANSATASQASATNSANSASSASASAGIATTKAEEATASATAAQESAVYTEGLLSTKVSITDLAAPQAALNVGSAVVSVDSIAELLTLPRKTFLTYRVASFHGGWSSRVPYLGPRGGGDFIWDATTTEPDNGGYTLAVVGVPTGRFQRVATGDIWMEEFGRVADGITDDTNACELASIYASNKGGGKVRLGSGFSPVTKLTVRSRVPVDGPGVRNGGFVALPVADPGYTFGMVEIDSGVVAECGWSNLTISGASNANFNVPPVNPTQWGLYARAKWDAGYTQGGLWHTTFFNVRIINFNRCVWSRAGYTDAHSLLPNQFVKFQDCQVGARGAIGSIGYMFTGQHGQIELENGYTGGMGTAPDDISDIGVLLTFDPTPSEVADNASGHGESTSDIAGVGQAARCPTGVMAMGQFACEKTRLGWKELGACSNNSVMETWFESVGICFDIQTGAQQFFQANRHANAGNGTVGAGRGNGSIAGTTLTIENDVSMLGRFAAGMSITGTGVTAGTTIVQQLTGSTGKSGTYQISVSQTVSTTFIQGGVGDGGIFREGVSSRTQVGPGGFMLGTVDNMVAASSVGLDQVQSWEYVGQGSKQTTGMTLFKNNRQHKIVVTDASGNVDMQGHPSCYVSPNADRTVRISNLHGWANPGQHRTLFAIGAVTVRSNGNISLRASGVPELTCPSGGALIFERIIPQLGTTAEWMLVSVTPHYATAIPTDGFYYSRGHKVWNNTIAAGGSLGWVNVAEGVAGTSTNFRVMPSVS